MRADILLERWQQLGDEARGTAKLDLVATVALAVRMRAALLEAHAAPRGPVEPPWVSLSKPEPRRSPTTLGLTVCVPSPPSVASITLGPLMSFARPGCAYTITLDIPGAPCPPSDVPLYALDRLVSVLATVSPAEPATRRLGGAGESEPPPLRVAFLPATTSVAAPARLRIMLHVPPMDPADLPARLAILRLTFAGEPIASDRLPVTVAIRDGLAAPLALSSLLAGGKGKRVTPAVAPGGLLFVPSGGGVLSFDPTGAPLGPQWKAGAEPHRQCAYYDGGEERDSPLLLLADSSATGPPIVAVRADRLPTASLRDAVIAWTSPGPSSLTTRACHGVAVLRRHRVAVATVKGGLFVVGLCGGSAGKLLAALRLDGRSFGDALPVPKGFRRPDDEPPDCIAADDTTGAVFVSADGSVLAFHWSGAALVPAGRVLAAGQSSPIDAERGGKRLPRPLAVVPGRGSGGAATLVVGVLSTDEARSLAIRHPVADMPLVSSGSLCPGAKIVGLAADPGGGALVICDGGRERAVRVVEWSQHTAWVAGAAPAAE